MSARRHSTPARPVAGRGKPADKAAQGERLQKVLAAAGIGSRRECELYITEGRVDVDGQVVTELGTRVDPSEQKIRVDGVPLTRPKRVYFAVNKPPGVVSTSRDPSGRMRVIDLVGANQRVFTVGRLDRSSEGLILVTNDGELANRLTHPRYAIEKTYQVCVAGQPDQADLDKLRKGIHLAEGVARVASVKMKRRHRQSTELEIVLQEGRNREIRRILARLGHKVMQLKRTAIGPLRLGDLPAGAHRPLTRAEVQQLERHGRGETGSAKKAGRKVKRPPTDKPAAASRTGQAAERPRPKAKRAKQVKRVKQAKAVKQAKRVKRKGQR